MRQHRAIEAIDKPDRACTCACLGYPLPKPVIGIGRHYHSVDAGRGQSVMRRIGVAPAAYAKRVAGNIEDDVSTAHYIEAVTVRLIVQRNRHSFICLFTVAVLVIAIAPTTRERSTGGIQAIQGIIAEGANDTGGDRAVVTLYQIAIAIIERVIQRHDAGDGLAGF